MIRSLLMEVLDEYPCMAFGSSQAALEWVEKNPDAPVELVVSDFDLPGPNGVKTCTTIRQRFPHIRVILMSGTSVEDIESLAIQNHFDGWARKPFSLMEMKQKVSNTLKIAHAQS